MLEWPYSATVPAAVPAAAVPGVAAPTRPVAADPRRRRHRRTASSNAAESSRVAGRAGGQEPAAVPRAGEGERVEAWVVIRGSGRGGGVMTRGVSGSGGGPSARCAGRPGRARTDSAVAMSAAPHARSFSKRTRVLENSRPRPFVPARNSATIAASTADEAHSRSATSRFGIAVGTSTRRSSVQRDAPSARIRSTATSAAQSAAPERRHHVRREERQHDRDDRDDLVAVADERGRTTGMTATMRDRAQHQHERSDRARRPATTPTS